MKTWMSWLGLGMLVLLGLALLGFGVFWRWCGVPDGWVPAVLGLLILGIAGYTGVGWFRERLTKRDLLMLRKVAWREPVLAGADRKEGRRRMRSLNKLANLGYILWHRSDRPFDITVKGWEYLDALIRRQESSTHA